MSRLLDPDERGLTWHDLSYRAKSAFAVLLSMAILVGGGWFVYAKANQAWLEFRQSDDYIGQGGQEVVVTIPRGATTYRISDILVANDVVKSAKTFDVEAAKNPKSGNIQAGRYRLKAQLPAAVALQMLLDPANMITTKVTIREGLRLSEIIPALAQPSAQGGTGIAAAEFETTLAEQADKIGLPEYADGKAEGYLFPETYNFATDGTALAVLQQMAAQYQAVATNLALEAKAKQLGRTPHELVTIASIVESEVRRNEDRPLVASVIHNRLAEGMPLQMDSTVHYAVGKSGTVTTSDEDRKSKSPYNTYLVAGLPPGPIGSPGRASLTAALSPTDTELMYFTTVNLDTGETKFTKDYDEHKANMATFQAWCQANVGKC